MDVKLFAPLLALGLVLALPTRADEPSPTEVVRVAWTRSTNASRRVARMLDMARRMGDVPQTMCLDDALNRIDSQVRVIESRAERIRRAEAVHDEAAAAREARLLAGVLRLLPQTEHVADACVGIVRNQTTVEAEIPPDTDWR